jgi:hypothetical protein
MFPNYPKSAEIQINCISDTATATFDVEFDKSPVTPTCIKNYLAHHGWRVVVNHPDTGEDLWQCDHAHAQNGYYKWEQAVAMQMFIFMNLGPAT